MDPENPNCSSFSALNTPTLPSRGGFTVSATIIILSLILAIVVVSIVIHTWIPVVVMLCIPFVISIIAGVIARKPNQNILIGQPPSWQGYTFEDEKVDSKRLN
jgi:peptidoglycan/LPS O-acetylase OafA/YrhL